MPLPLPIGWFMSYRFPLGLLVLALSAPLSGPASAEEVLLYDDPPPADAAFVRFLGQTGDSIDWKGLTFTPPEGSALSDYFVVHAPAIGHTAGDILSVLPGSVTLIEPAKNPAKVTIGLVNLGEGDISLKTADGKVAIIEGVKPSEAGWREVNPVSVAVQVYEGDTPLGAPLDLALRRNEHRTLVLGSDGALSDVTSAVVPGVVE